MAPCSHHHKSSPSKILANNVKLGPFLCYHLCLIIIIIIIKKYTRQIKEFSLTDLGCSEKTKELISLRMEQPQSTLLHYCFRAGREQKGELPAISISLSLFLALSLSPSHSTPQKEQQPSAMSLSEPHTYWLRADLTVFVQLQERKELYRKKKEKYRGEDW